MSEPCEKCGREWIGRHILPLEDDERGDEKVTWMHGEGDHCIMFRDNE